MKKENIWEFVISNSDIISIIGQYVNLTKQGKNYKACCPFHGEKTPSFIVSAEKQIFKCFGCGKSGNVLKFVEFQENLNSLEALKMLANKQNLDVSQFDNFLANNPKNEENLKIFEINQAALDFFRYQIIFEKNDELSKFLEKRHLSKEIIKEFEIGFASKNKLIYQKLVEQKFDNFAIFNSSLISNLENKNFFNDRLIFPIKDKNGNIVAFSGRDITDLHNPKYLNSGETIVFKKNEVMFNYFHAKDEIINKNEVYLVEGQFDCIALYKAGIKNSVAIMGTSLSINHLKELSNKAITLFFDSDEAGINATLKNLKIILYYSDKYNIKVNFVINNLNKDPDELFNLDNGETLRKLCNQKIDIVQYLYNWIKKITNLKISELNKFEEYKKIFEYIYYLNEQLRIILEERVVSENILSSKLFNSYFNQYAKPNFPSDLSFKTKILLKGNNYEIKNSNIKNELEIDKFFVDLNPNTNENINFNEQFNYVNLNIQNKKNNSKKVDFQKQISPQYNLIKEIFISILANPFFAKEFYNENFHMLALNNTGQTLREITSYIIKKTKEGNLITFDNLEQIIDQDIKNTKNSLFKDKYNLFKEEILNISKDEFINPKINNFDLLMQKVEQLIDKKRIRIKKIITNTKGE
ncbi:DNA primase [Metamycoplasma canadense]|uniref:DNA primase n=1 Tax=Metamycoplasma canadense TaxID=29554 RepID=A0A077LCG1_9BACT|nr:DNA primase [Metamycoplasma canadense]BAP39774.1 DNA primase [Metamycoplasma canadense]